MKKIMMLKAIACILALATVRVIGGDYLLYDIGALVKVNLTGREESKRVVVIEIDDETLESIHQYPLARHYYLSALRNIKNSSLVIIDILFTGYSQYDKALYDFASTSGNLVLATTVFKEKVPTFYEKAVGIGHAFIPFDENRVVRSFPPKDALQDIASSLYHIMGYGEVRNDYDLLIWPKREEFIIYSFKEVLVNPIEVNGAIVILGYASTATDDVLRIPLRGTIPGVYSHASYLFNVINHSGVYLITFPWILIPLFNTRRPFVILLYTSLPLFLLTFTSYYIQLELLIFSSLIYTLSYKLYSYSLKSKNLEVLALKDGLTGLSNRRAFDNNIQQLWLQYPYITLLMIDIDFFKKYNDCYGHPKGDEVLKRVASSFHQCVRETDLVARYGGEEFILALPSKIETFSIRVMEICEKLNREVKNLNIIHKDSPLEVVTISIGAITVSTINMSVPSAISLVDLNLYKAKAKGRNTFFYG